MASNPGIFLADCDAWIPAVFASTLSAEERSRAERYRRSVDRDRFVVRRGLLRRLLADRLACPPGEVRLRADPHGKPFLETQGRTPSGPAFNLSRSGGLVLYALAADPDRGLVTGPGAAEGPAIGVDLERVDGERRTLDDFHRIAGHFATEESLFLRTLPSPAATAAFYRFWTCKEACLKCLGTGIGGTGAPTLADVALDIAADGDVSRARWSRGGREWILVCLEPCVGHAAAVALPAGDGRRNDEWDRVLESRRVEPDGAERRVSRGDEPLPGLGPGAP